MWLTCVRSATPWLPGSATPADLEDTPGPGLTISEAAGDQAPDAAAWCHLPAELCWFRLRAALRVLTAQFVFCSTVCTNILLPPCRSSALYFANLFCFVFGASSRLCSSSFAAQKRFYFGVGVGFCLWCRPWRPFFFTGFHPVLCLICILINLAHIWFLMFFSCLLILFRFLELFGPTRAPKNMELWNRWILFFSFLFTLIYQKIQRTTFEKRVLPRPPHKDMKWTLL